jgi:hypothetical protein
MSSFLRGPHHLGDKALRPLAAAIAVTDPTWADLDVVVAGSHGRSAFEEAGGWRAGY